MEILACIILIIVGFIILASTVDCALDDIIGGIIFVIGGAMLLIGGLGLLDIIKTSISG